MSDNTEPGQAVPAETDANEPVNTNNLLRISKQYSETFVQDHLYTDLVEKLATDEYNTRLDLMVRAVGAVKLAQSEYNKLNHPDVKTYDTNGTEVKHFSADRFKQRKESKDKLDKLTRAVDLALEKKDFSKVTDLVK